MTLRLATEAEKRARDLVTFPEWGTRLTLPQYLERENALRAHPWAQAGMRTWLLAEGDDVLCSAETFANDSSVGARDGVSHSIASVYTEEGKRGRGHAKRLMDALVGHFRAEGAQALVLFSDVGPGIYAKSGYRPVPAFDWVLPPADGPAEVDWLDAPVPAPARVRPPDGTLRLHPSAAQLDWHHARSRLYSGFLARPRLAHFGARTAHATAWWTAQFKSNELLVLWLDAPDARAAEPLLRAAQQQAHALGLARVRLWETLPLADVTGAQRLQREAELPMSVALAMPFDRWDRVERALWV